MKSVLEILQVPFWGLRFEQQLLVIVLLVGCMCLGGWSVSFAARRLRERRRESRRRLNNPVELSWQDGEGLQRSVLGQCIDSSALGLRVELPALLEVHSRVDFRVLGLNLAGKAVVRNCTHAGPRYVVGLEIDRASAELGASPDREEYRAGLAESRRTHSMQEGRGVPR